MPKSVLFVLFCLILCTAVVTGLVSSGLPPTDEKYLHSDPIEREWHHECLTDELIRKLNLKPLQLLEKAKYINTRPALIIFGAGYPPASAKGADRLRMHLDWWITLNDVVMLAKRIDSNVPCVRIYGDLTSDAWEGFSTEGIEASRMIYGYMKHGAYPIQLSNPLNWTESAKPIVSEVKVWLKENHISTRPVD